MARVYKVVYQGKTYWIPESGDCENNAEAAAKVTGCKPGYNCTVSTRFTGDLTAQEYIAQQEAGTTVPEGTTTGGGGGGTTSGGTTGGGTTSGGTYLPPASTEEPAPTPTNAIPGLAQGYDWNTWRAYEKYLTEIQQPGYEMWPVPKDIADWINNFDQWVRLYEQGGLTHTRTSEESFWIEGQKNVAGQVLGNKDIWFNPDGTPVEWITPGGEPLEGLPEEEAQKYWENPLYYPTFTDWFNQQQDFSGAFRGFVENKYPSLAAQYQYNVGHLQGFPSEEEALANAQNIEQGFQGWLTEQVPGVYQEYMGQRPYMRGERYSDYSPTTRLVNW